MGSMSIMHWTIVIASTVPSTELHEERAALPPAATVSGAKQRQGLTQVRGTKFARTERRIPSGSMFTKLERAL